MRKPQKLEKVSFFEATKFIESKGYDIQPIKKGNIFKIIIWRGDESLGEGKYNYKTLEEARRKTTFDFYDALSR